MLFPRETFKSHKTQSCYTFIETSIIVLLKNIFSSALYSICGFQIISMQLSSHPFVEKSKCFIVATEAL